MFTLIDRDGKRMYGMCMRTLFQGEERRYDVKRRPRHCLCIITRNPFISLFRTLLLEIHALSMIEDQPGSARGFVELAYTQSLSIRNQNNERITISRSALPDLARDFNIIPPRYSRLSRVATILPLLEALGVEKFLLILSAVLCERKLILIADETSTLITAVHAMGAMLHPFQWQHICIPLLPSKLLNYASTKVPYIMGIRRYLYQQLLKESLNDVILVDIDKGEYRVINGASITDFVGESGTALKQATESLDRVRQRASDMANMFLRNTGANVGNTDIDNGPKDMVAVIVNELRTALANKPGGSSVASVASGLFRGLPGGAKITMEESKGIWALETEKLLRDTLLQFFVYLFADIDEYLSNSSRSNDSNSVTDFDKSNFMNKRASSAVGDSKAMLEFLNDFSYSKMFLKFCDEKIIEKNERTNGTACVDWGKGEEKPIGFSKERYQSNVVDEEDDFHSICSDIRLKCLIKSVANVRTCVSNRTARTATALNIDNMDGNCKGLIGMEFDILTVQYTLGNNSSNYVFNNNNNNNNNNNDDMTSDSINNTNQQIIDKICSDSQNSDTFFRIMNTITLRLENCKAATCRGTNASCGVRAMNLLRALLVLGPECVLSASIDYIPIIRILLNMCNTNTNNNNLQNQGLDFSSLGPIVDIRPLGVAVLSLLVDHKKLILQRKYAILCKKNFYYYLYYQSPSLSFDLFSPLNHQKGYKRQSDLIRKELFTVVTQVGVSHNSGMKQFPKFNLLHNSFKPYGAINIDPSKLLLTEPTETFSERRDDDDDNNDDNNNGRDRDDDIVAPLVSNHNSNNSLSLFHISTKPKPAEIDLLDDIDTYDSFSNQPVLTPSTPSSNPMMSSFQPTSSSTSTATNVHTSSLHQITNFNSPSTPASSTTIKNTNIANNSNILSSGNNLNNSNIPRVKSDSFDEDSIYRIINKDTGEVSDMRDLDKMISMTKIVSTPQKNNISAPKPSPSSHSIVPTLAPPPSGQIRRVPLHNNSAKLPNNNNTTTNNNNNYNGSGSGGGPRTNSSNNSTDPFATLKPLIPNSPIKSPKGSGQSVGPTGQNSTDPFNFSAFNFTPSGNSKTTVSSFVPSSTQAPSPFSPSPSTGMSGSSSTPFLPSTSISAVRTSISTNNNSKNGMMNPFEGFDSSISQGNGNLNGNGNGNIRKSISMGINSQQAARDQEGSTDNINKGGGGGGDLFADLVGNMKK